MSSLDLGGMLALVFFLSAAALVLVVIPACIISGRISEMERRASQPNDNNELSFGNGSNEADNAD